MNLFSSFDYFSFKGFTVRRPLICKHEVFETQIEAFGIFYQQYEMLTIQ